MRSDPDAEAVADQALLRPGLLAGSRLICVDGPAGSGKTTLAGQVADRCRSRGRTAAVVHMDDLYEGWDGLDLGPEPRVVSQLLSPLAAGRPARWQRYDWHARRFGDWVDQDRVDVLVLEGCGSGALAYAPHRTLLVWVEARRETRIARGVERDGEAVLPRWIAWMDSEARHFAANDTRSRADLVFCTDPAASGDVGRQ